MIALTLASSVLLTVALAVSLLNLFFAPRLHHLGKGDTAVRASLLVPARNEAHHLPRLLGSLPAADPGLEILVLDDQSTDRTAEVVREAAARDRRIRLLEGADRPPGWTGKNWACQQLANAARGEILIFCDADIEILDGAIAATVSGLRRWDALSAMPRHHFAGWFDAAVEPLITQTSIVTLLPVPLVPRLRSPFLSAATGQWIAFRRDAYRQIGGHAAVRDRVLEDVELGRRVKRMGRRFALLLGGRSLSVRMYASAADTVEGFTKNSYALAGNSAFGLAAALIVFYLLALHPFVAAALGFGFLPLALLGATRTLEVWMVRGRAISLLLHPAGALALIWIALRSARLSGTGGATWKGRPVLNEKIPRP